MSKKSTATKTPKTAKRSAKGITLNVIAKDAGVPERKARRVARQLGLGVGKGSRYSGFTKGQATKLHKALVP